MSDQIKAQPSSEDEETKRLLAERNININTVVNNIDDSKPGLFGKVPIKAFLLAAAGNFFEYYDFGLLGYFTDGI